MDDSNWISPYGFGRPVNTVLLNLQLLLGGNAVHYEKVILKPIPAELDADFCCPLDTVPFSLQLLITEKMTYQDFATFNLCDKHSAAVCDKHPADIGLQFEMDTVRLNWHLLSKFPSYVRLSCDFLYLTGLCDLKRIERHVKKVNKLHIDFREDAYYFLQQALKLIKPRSLYANSCRKEMFFIPEVQEPTSLVASREEEGAFETPAEHRGFFGNTQFCEPALLGLKASYLYLYQANVSPDTAFKFIQQWISGDRQIECVYFISSEYSFDFPYFDRLLSLMDGSKFARKPGHRDSCLCVCRTDEHYECILVDVSRSDRVKMERIRNMECPAEYWKQFA